MIGFIVGVFIGVIFGFFTCAILSAGKVRDLEKENIDLTKGWNERYNGSLS